MTFESVPNMIKEMPYNQREKVIQGHEEEFGIEGRYVGTGRQNRKLLASLQKNPELLEKFRGEKNQITRATKSPLWSLKQVLGEPKKGKEHVPNNTTNVDVADASVYHEKKKIEVKKVIVDGTSAPLHSLKQETELRPKTFFDSLKGTLSLNRNTELPTEMVKEFEGFKKEAHWDHKQWSIGYGTKGKQGEVIGTSEAARRLNKELSKHAKEVDKLATRYKIELTPNQRKALISFDYNTSRAERIMEVFSQSGKEAAASKILEFRRAGKKILRGLETRRDKESKLFLS